MAYPVAVTPTPAGSANPNPAYSSVFIPAVWSKRLAEKLYSYTVLSRVTTMGWDDADNGKTVGDRVIVRTMPTITIRPYEVNGPLVVERPSSGVLNIPTDYGLYFYALVDDVYEAQSDLLLLDMIAAGAAEDMKVALEAYYLPKLLLDIDAANKGATAGKASLNVNLGTAGAPTQVAGTPDAGSNSPVQTLAKMAQVLDEQGVSPVGRFAIVPPWFAAALESTPDVIGASGGGFEAGMVGRVARFDVYSSVNLSAAQDTIFAGSRNGLAFASALTQLELVRREDTFATGLRGLQISGFQTIDPKMLTVAYVAPGAGGYNSSACLGTDLLPVTPSNSTVLPPNLGFRVRTAGDVVFTGVGATTSRTLTGMQSGQIVPVMVKYINTGTTAGVDLILA